MILAVTLILLLFGVRLFSITPYVVMSGSMDPVYPVGSIVYVKQVEPDQLSVGDDISFYFSEDVVATHRIGEIHEDERNVQTYYVTETAEYVIPENDLFSGKTFTAIYEEAIDIRYHDFDGKILYTAKTTKEEKRFFVEIIQNQVWRANQERNKKWKFQLILKHLNSFNNRLIKWQKRIKRIYVL